MICPNLTVVELPNSVRSIDFEAFAHCKNLKKVIVHNENVDFYKEVFIGYTNLVIYGHAGSTAEECAQKYGVEFREL